MAASPQSTVEVIEKWLERADELSSEEMPLKTAAEITLSMLLVAVEGVDSQNFSRALEAMGRDIAKANTEDQNERTEDRQICYLVMQWIHTVFESISDSNTNVELEGKDEFRILARRVPSMMIVLGKLSSLLRSAASDGLTESVRYQIDSNVSAIKRRLEDEVNEDPLHLILLGLAESTVRTIALLIHQRDPRAASFDSGHGANGIDVAATPRKPGRKPAIKTGKKSNQPEVASNSSAEDEAGADAALAHDGPAAPVLPQQNHVVSRENSRVDATPQAQVSNGVGKRATRSTVKNGTAPRDDADEPLVKMAKMAGPLIQSTPTGRGRGRPPRSRGVSVAPETMSTPVVERPVVRAKSVTFNVGNETDEEEVEEEEQMPLTRSARARRLLPNGSAKQSKIEKAKDLRASRSTQQEIPEGGAYIYPNRGDDCFANSAVNALLAFTPFIDELKQLPSGESKVADLLKEASERRPTALGEESVPQQLRRVCNFDARPNQDGHDAAEFVRELVRKSRIQRPHPDDTLTTDTFWVDLAYRATCRGCEKWDVVDLAHEQLILAFGKPEGAAQKNATIETIVRQVAIETFRGDASKHTPACGGRKGRIDVKLVIKRMPRYLLVTPQEVEINPKDLKSTGTFIFGRHYVLQAAIVYTTLNTAASGAPVKHYVSYRRLPEGRGWSVANDGAHSIVTELPEGAQFRVLSFMSTSTE